MSHSHMTEDGTYEPISVGAQVGHCFLFVPACASLRATPRFVLTHTITKLNLFQISAMTPSKRHGVIRCLSHSRNFEIWNKLKYGIFELFKLKKWSISYTRAVQGNIWAILDPLFWAILWSTYRRVMGPNIQSV